jgi:hypothetical protein
MSSALPLGPIVESRLSIGQLFYRAGSSRSNGGRLSEASVRGQRILRRRERRMLACPAAVSI